MRGPSTTAGSLAQIPLLETDDLITSGWKTSGHCDWDSQPLARVPVDPPKGLEHGLPNWWTCFLWTPTLSSCSNDVRDIRRGTKFPGTKVMAAASFLQHVGDRRIHCFFTDLSSLTVCLHRRPPPLSLHNLVNTVHPPWWFPENLPHPTWESTQAASSGFPIQTACLSHAADFPVISQRFPKPKQPASGFSCPLPPTVHTQDGTTGSRLWFTTGLLRHLQS